MQKKNKKKQITIELGNAVQKGRYERETHARLIINWLEKCPTNTLKNVADL